MEGVCFQHLDKSSHKYSISHGKKILLSWSSPKMLFWFLMQFVVANFCQLYLLMFVGFCWSCSCCCCCICLGFLLMLFFVLVLWGFFKGLWLLVLFCAFFKKSSWVGKRSTYSVECVWLIIFGCFFYPHVSHMNLCYQMCSLVWPLFSGLHVGWSLTIDFWFVEEEEIVDFLRGWRGVGERLFALCFVY